MDPASGFLLRVAVGIGTVEADDIAVSIFDPDAAQEPPGARARFGPNVEHQRSHLAQKLAAHEDEIIMGAIVVIQVDEHHVHEPGRRVGNLESCAQRPKNIGRTLEEALRLVSGFVRLGGEALAEIDPVQHVFVRRR